MKIMPLMDFWMRRHEQIEALFSGRNPGALLEVVAAVIPVIEKRWPQLNKDGILDDALKTLVAAMDDPDITDAVEHPGGRQI